jgi:hypothetical protein
MVQLPLSDEVREALIEYRDLVPFAGPHVNWTERSLETSPQAIVNMYQRWCSAAGAYWFRKDGTGRIRPTRADSK